MKPDGPQSDHLTPEDFLEFIEQGLQGWSQESLEHHLMSCPECLETLDMILLGEAPATEEEETVLRRLSGQG